MVIRCTRCNSSNWIKAGLQWRDGIRNVQRRRCKDCGKIFILAPDVEGAEIKQEKN